MFKFFNKNRKGRQENKKLSDELLLSPASQLQLADIKPRSISKPQSDSQIEVNNNKELESSDDFGRIRRLKTTQPKSRTSVYDLPPPVPRGRKLAPRPYSELVAVRSDSKINWQGVLRGQPMKAVLTDSSPETSPDLKYQRSPLQQNKVISKGISPRSPLQKSLSPISPKLRCPPEKYRQNNKRNSRQSLKPQLIQPKSSLTQILVNKSWKNKSEQPSKESTKEPTKQPSKEPTKQPPRPKSILVNKGGSKISERRRQVMSMGNLLPELEFNNNSTTCDPTPCDPTPCDPAAALAWKANILSNQDPMIPSDIWATENTIPSPQLSPNSLLNSASLFNIDIKSNNNDSSLQQQLQISQLKLQLELTRKQLRAQQITNKNLESNYLERDQRREDNHQLELRNVRQLCSQRVQQLVYVIDELQSNNKKLIHHIEQAHIDLPKDINQTLINRDFSDDSYLINNESQSSLNNQFDTAELNQDNNDPLQGSLTPLTMYRFIESQFQSIVQTDPLTLPSTLTPYPSLDPSTTQHNSFRLNQLISSIDRTTSTIMGSFPTKPTPSVTFHPSPQLMARH